MNQNKQNVHVFRAVRGHLRGRFRELLRSPGGVRRSGRGRGPPRALQPAAAPQFGGPGRPAHADLRAKQDPNHPLHPSLVHPQKPAFPVQQRRKCLLPVHGRARSEYFPAYTACP